MTCIHTDMPVSTHHIDVYTPVMARAFPTKASHVPHLTQKRSVAAWQLGRD